MIQKRFISIGAFSGLCCVGLGAFGAHALKAWLQPEQLTVFETAVRYQFYHSLSLLLTALLYDTFSLKAIKTTGYFFIAGIIIFSGSLYLMVASYLFTTPPWKWLGAITPVGGICFLCGWISMFIFSLQIKQIK